MDWESNMEALNQCQEKVDQLVKGLEEYLAEIRPALLGGVITDEAERHVDNPNMRINLTIGPILRQLTEYNRIIIMMLTDLDYRKGEPK